MLYSESVLLKLLKSGDLPYKLPFTTLEISDANPDGSGLAEIFDELRRHHDISTLLQIDLSVNHIEKLEPGIFAGLTGLKYLDLGSNRLKSLPETLFDSLINLEELRLDGNLLDQDVLPENLFHNLGKLKILDLSENKLSILPKMLFWHLTALRDLNLSRNHFSYMPEALFQGLNLKSLKLNLNRIQALPDAATLQALLTLHNLDISGNRLSNSNIKALQTLLHLLRDQGSLKTLNISHNEFSAYRYTSQPDIVQDFGGGDLFVISVGENFKLDSGSSVPSVDDIAIPENMWDDVFSRIRYAHFNDEAILDKAINEAHPWGVTFSEDMVDTFVTLRETIKERNVELLFFYQYKKSEENTEFANKVVVKKRECSNYIEYYTTSLIKSFL